MTQKVILNLREEEIKKNQLLGINPEEFERDLPAAEQGDAQSHNRSPLGPGVRMKIAREYDFLYRPFEEKSIRSRKEREHK